MNGPLARALASTATFVACAAAVLGAACEPPETSPAFPDAQAAAPLAVTSAPSLSPSLPPADDGADNDPPATQAGEAGSLDGGKPGAGPPEAGPPGLSASELSASELSPPEAVAPTPLIERLEKPLYLRHRAAPMETLEQVAYRYGVTVERLRRWNGLSEAFALQKVWRKPKLKVWARRNPPARIKVQHTVAELETWGTIARAHGAASTDMRAYNVKNVGRKIEVGEILDIWVDPIVLAEVRGPPRDDGLRRGAYSIGSPNEGRLVNPVKLPDSPDYTLGFPNSVWGTTTAVGALIRGLHAWRTTSGYTGVLRIGTMSRQRGGEVGHHKSHQSGRDIDIRLPIKADQPQGLNPEAYRVDWWATYQLLDTLVAQPEVAVIFFDYKLQRRIAKAAEAHGVDAARLETLLQWPIGSKASRGMVKHEPGHTQHIHVRFHCGGYETECVEK